MQFFNKFFYLYPGFSILVISGLTIQNYKLKRHLTASSGNFIFQRRLIETNGWPFVGEENGSVIITCIIDFFVRFARMKFKKFLILSRCPAE